VLESAKELEAAGLFANGYELDITNREKTLWVFAEIAKEIGPIYCLVNNAGAVDQRLFVKCDQAVFHRMFRVNVYGTV